MSDHVHLPHLVWDKSLELTPDTSVAMYAEYCDTSRMDILAVPPHLQPAVIAHQMGEVEDWHFAKPPAGQPEFTKRERYWGRRLFEGDATEDDLEKAGLDDRQYLNAIAVCVDLEDGYGLDQG